MNFNLHKSTFKEKLSAAGVSASDLQLFDLIMEVPISETNPNLKFQPVVTSVQNPLKTSMLLSQNDAFFGFAFSLGVKKVSDVSSPATQIYCYPELSVFSKPEEQRGLTALYNGSFDFATQINKSRISPIINLSTQNFLVVPQVQMRDEIVPTTAESQYVDIGFSYILTGRTTAQEFTVRIGDTNLSGIGDTNKNYAVLRIKGFLAVGAGEAMARYLGQ